MTSLEVRPRPIAPGCSVSTTASELIFNGRSCRRRHLLFSVLFFDDHRPSLCGEAGCGRWGRRWAVKWGRHILHDFAVSSFLLSFRHRPWAERILDSRAFRRIYIMAPHCCMQMWTIFSNSASCAGAEAGADSGAATTGEPATAGCAYFCAVTSLLRSSSSAQFFLSLGNAGLF